MPNDITTLNGALRQLGETMASNLTTQGVPSTYDEGLTTLAGKILDIQGGGSSFDGITLTSDKDILSYNGGTNPDVATLTSQLTLSGQPVAVSGETVTFEVRKVGDGSLVETLTGVTDVNGVATVSYTSKGAGDIYIKAECNLLIQTFSIQDCIYYHDMTSSDATHWTIPSSANATYSSDGMKLPGSAWSDCYLEIALDKPMEIDVDITHHWSTYNTPPFSTYMYDALNKDRKYQIFYEANTRKLINDYYNNQSNASGSFTLPSAFNLKIKVKSDSIEVYIDGTLYVTKSNYNLVSPFIFGVTTASNRYTTYKNMKVKPL